MPGEHGGIIGGQGQQLVREGPAAGQGRGGALFRALAHAHGVGVLQHQLGIAAQKDLGARAQGHVQQGMVGLAPFGQGHEQFEGRVDGGRDEVAGQTALGTAQPGDAQALPVPVPVGQQGKVGQGLARRALVVARIDHRARQAGGQAVQGAALEPGGQTEPGKGVERGLQVTGGHVLCPERGRQQVHVHAQLTGRGRGGQHVLRVGAVSGQQQGRFAGQGGGLALHLHQLPEGGLPQVTDTQDLPGHDNSLCCT